MLVVGLLGLLVYVCVCPEAKKALAELCGFFSIAVSDVPCMATALELEKVARTTLSSVMLLRVLEKPHGDKVKLRRGAQTVIKECQKHGLTLIKPLADRANLAMTMSL